MQRDFPIDVAIDDLWEIAKGHSVTDRHRAVVGEFLVWFLEGLYWKDENGHMVDVAVDFDFYVKDLRGGV